MGYLLPTENVMQNLSFALMLFAFGGGLFIPLSQMSQTLQTIAKFSPLYGLNTLVHAPRTESAWTPGPWPMSLSGSPSLPAARSGA
jgi:ABC-2 type transport system permease protein